MVQNDAACRCRDRCWASCRRCWDLVGLVWELVATLLPVPLTSAPSRVAAVVIRVRWRDRFVSGRHQMSQLPPQGRCSGVTCGGVCGIGTRAACVRPCRAALAQLRAAGLLDLERCAVDASHVHALKGGIMSGPPRSTVAIPAPSTT